MEWFSYKSLVHSSNVMQNVTNQIGTFLASRQGLGQNIRLIVVGVDVCDSPLIFGSPLSNKMVCNRARLLLQLGVRPGRISQDGLVVPKDVGWALNRNAHHPKLIPQPTDVLTALFHGNEFRSKKSLSPRWFAS